MQVAVPVPAGAVKATPATVRAVVQVAPGATRTFSGVSLAVRNAPSGLSVQVVRPITVDVTVSGPAAVVRRMKPDDLSAYVDASALKPGAVSAPVLVETPKWVQVTQLSAATAAVQVR
ncbi:MAG: hypothetical protein K6T30_07345, partial [Alicyclobacillus sp.]|nr:hypothetical protein [Alicyclobacillus sp.]